MFCSARTSSYFLNLGTFRLRRYCGTGNKPRLPRESRNFGVLRGTGSVDSIPLLMNGLEWVSFFPLAHRRERFSGMARFSHTLCICSRTWKRMAAFLFVFIFLRQGLLMELWLAWNSHCLYLWVLGLKVNTPTAPASPALLPCSQGHTTSSPVRNVLMLQIVITNCGNRF